jgi:hypothetical protein
MLTSAFQGIVSRICTTMESSKAIWTIGGLALGLALGVLVSSSRRETPLQAVATHGQDNFAICTAPMDQDVEAVFVLDFVTGDLKASVMNVQTRRFNTLFEHNVLQDLPTLSVKNPQYRMVSGFANIRQNIAAGQLASSVIYVAEVTSGQVVAYGVPWTSGRASGGAPVKAQLIPLDRWQFRTTAIRNP